MATRSGRPRRWSDGCNSCVNLIRCFHRLALSILRKLTRPRSEVASTSEGDRFQEFVVLSESVGVRRIPITLCMQATRLHDKAFGPRLSQRRCGETDCVIDLGRRLLARHMVENTLSWAVFLTISHGLQNGLPQIRFADKSTGLSVDIRVVKPVSQPLPHQNR